MRIGWHYIALGEPFQNAFIEASVERDAVPLASARGQLWRRGQLEPLPTHLRFRLVVANPRHSS